MSHITDEAGEPALKVNIVRLINLLETHGRANEQILKNQNQMMKDIRDLKKAFNNIPQQAIGLKEVAIKRQYAQKKNGMLADIFPITTSAELTDFNQRLSDNTFNGSVVSDM